MQIYFQRVLDPDFMVLLVLLVLVLLLEMAWYESRFQCSICF